MNVPWGKKYTVRCPDGKKKTVYKNVDDAFPLFIPGVQANVAAGASGSAKAIGVDELKGELKAEYATKVQGLLFGIDELTQTIMLNFRSVYLTFSSDPCSHSEFFLRQVEKLVAEQGRLSRLRIQVRLLTEMAKSQPDQTVGILSMFKEIAGVVGGAPGIEATVIEIVETRQLAKKWSEE